jgi:hypothetical protein
MACLPACTAAALLVIHASPPTPGPSFGRTWPVQRGMLAIVTSSTPPQVDASPIGKQELVRARELLSRTRDQVEPQQWEVLDRSLAEAEQAFEHLNSVAQAGAETTAVVRGAEGVANPGRAGAAVEALAEAGPMLIALILLWPSSTAGNDVDHGPAHPASAVERARLNFEAKLRNVSLAAQKVTSEIEAAKRRGSKGVPGEKRRDAPKSAQGGNPPGEPPCSVIGYGGKGPFQPEGAPPAKMRCSYLCGDEQVELDDVVGKSKEDCETPGNLARAARQAAKQRAGGGPTGGFKRRR